IRVVPVKRFQVDLQGVTEEAVAGTERVRGELFRLIRGGHGLRESAGFEAGGGGEEQHTLGRQVVFQSGAIVHGIILRDSTNGPQGAGTGTRETPGRWCKCSAGTLERLMLIGVADSTDQAQCLSERVSQLSEGGRAVSPGGVEHAQAL